MTQQQTERQWNSLAFLRLGAFGFGISGFFMAMDTIILPVLVLGVVPAGAKNSLLGDERQSFTSEFVSLICHMYTCFNDMCHTVHSVRTDIHLD